MSGTGPSGPSSTTRPAGVTTRVTLFARPGCHLCDEAREEIARRRPRLPAFELREIDIDSEDRLLSAFLERIPVVEVDGAIVSELEFDGESFAQALVG